MERCLTLEDFERRAAGGLSPEERKQFDRHIAVCPACRKASEEGADHNQFLRRVKSVLGRKAHDDRSGTRTRVTRPQQVPVSWSVDASDSPATSAKDYLPHIEGYVIRGVLGRGGMGVVYEAVQTKLSRTVALKLLPAILSSSHPQTIERFHREAAAAAKLHHRNIISIYDFGESRDGYYYAMELIEGQPISTVIKRLAADPTHHETEDSIAELLRVPDSRGGSTRSPSAGQADSGEAPPHPIATKGRFYYTQVAHWMAHVADALHYAHLNDLVHRDIKPSNLMLATDGRILVLDFGLVKASGDESVTVSGSLVGTYRYMSPEQLGAKRIPVDARTDIYSLGATMYELLTLQPAFNASERPMLLSEIMFREPTLPRRIVPSVPPELENICLKAMEKSPDARYQSAGMMAEDLRRFINDLPIIARRQGPLRRAYKFVRRHRVGVTAITAIVLLAATAALTVVQARKGRRELLEKGAALQTSESWLEAEQVYRKLLFAGQTRFKALLNLAIIKDKRFNRERKSFLLTEANDLCDRALREQPDHPSAMAAWNSKGAVLLRLGRLDEAHAALQKAIDIDKEWKRSRKPYPVSSVLSNLGPVYARQGDLLKAEKTLLDAEKQANAEAEEEYDILSVYKTGPSINTVLNLAVIQAHLGKPQARRRLEQAWKMTRGGQDRMLHRPEIHLLEAKLLLAVEKDAYAALKAAITADVDSDIDDPQALIKRYLALAEMRNDQWRRSMESARRALELGDPPAYARLIMAIAQARLGEPAAARENLGKALAQWPPSLRDADAFDVSWDGEMLWIESAAELFTLRAEAEELINTLAANP